MSRRLTNIEFIEKAQKVHGSRFIYLEDTYVKSSMPIKVVCREHGQFTQIAGDHLRGFGCSACTGKRRLSTEQFMQKANEVHSNRYSYNNTNYISSNKPVSITCKKHGDFSIKPNHHLYGTKNGCPKCCYSKGEVITEDWLRGNSIKFIPQAKFEGCVNPTTGRQLRFDFYIEINNLCIEVDGVQHQSGKHYMRGKCLNMPDIALRDAAKDAYCKSLGMLLVRVPWEGKKDDLVAQLQNIFKQLNSK